MQIGSIDAGYGYIKALVGSSRWCQQAVLGESIQLHKESIRETDVRYNDYFVGDLAVRHSPVIFAGTKDEKANTWTTKILIETGLGMTAQTGDICLVTGLPVDYYFNQVNEMKAMLEEMKTESRFTLTVGQSTKIYPNFRVVQSKIIPQPLGSDFFVTHDSQGILYNKEVAKSLRIVIDWGMFTLDILVMRGPEIIQKLSSSTNELGVSKVYRLLQNYFQEKFDKKPNLFEFDSIVASGEYEGYNITPLANKAFEAVCTQIVMEIESLNTNFSYYIITGGRSDILQKYIPAEEKKKFVLDQMGNVRGYEIIGRKVFR